MTFSALQTHLIQLAEYAWENRLLAHQFGMNLSEETLTELFLFHLATTFPNSVYVYPFSKTEEHKNGADWEWCFASFNPPAFLRVRVQAKALYRPFHYRALKLPTPKGGTQLETFIARCAADSLPGLYCFYNFALPSPALPSSYKPTQAEKTYSPALWGVSVADPLCVASAADTSFLTIGKTSEPWHRLLNVTPSLGNLWSPGSVLDQARKLRLLSGKAPPSGLHLPLPHEPTSKSPQYVSQILTRFQRTRTTSAPGFDPSMFGLQRQTVADVTPHEEIPAWQMKLQENRHLAGIVLFVQRTEG